MMPNTPRQLIKESQSAFTPTPYVAFTAFVSKQDPFLSTAHATPLLDEAEDPLAVVYNQLIRFVDRDLSQILLRSERISATSGENTFQIMANVVAAEFFLALTDELGSVIFVAGHPDEFRKRHETSQAFLRTLEHQAPSTNAVQAMRKHATYEAFQKRWQLPVYFQLRWKSIVEQLEEVMFSEVLALSHSKPILVFTT